MIWHKPKSDPSNNQQNQHQIKKKGGRKKSTKFTFLAVESGREGTVGSRNDISIRRKRRRMWAIPKEVTYKMEPPLVLIDKGLRKGRPVSMPIDCHSEPIPDLETQRSSPLLPYPLPDPLTLHRGLGFGFGLCSHREYREWGKYGDFGPECGSEY